MKNKICIDTLGEVKQFVDIVSGLPGKIVLTDNNGYRVNGKSILGAIAALEFEELWVESEEDIYSAIKNYIVI